MNEVVSIPMLADQLDRDDAPRLSSLRTDQVIRQLHAHAVAIQIVADDLVRYGQQLRQFHDVLNERMRTGDLAEKPGVQAELEIARDQRDAMAKQLQRMEDERDDLRERLDAIAQRHTAPVKEPTRRGTDAPRCFKPPTPDGPWPGWKRQPGEPPSAVIGLPPYGIRFIGEQAVAVEYEQRVLTVVREARAQGVKWQRIADRLNDASLRTRRGNRWTARGVELMYERELARQADAEFAAADACST